MDLAEIDLTNPDHFVAGTPHHWFKALRAQDPVHWHPEPDGPGFWCVTKYDDLKQRLAQPAALLVLARRHEHPRRRRGGAAAAAHDHAEHGPAAARQVPPHRAARLHAAHGRRSRSPTSASWPGASSTPSRPAAKCEFVEELAAELPLQVICELMGVPLEDRKLIFELTNTHDRLRRSRSSAATRRSACKPRPQIFGYSMKLAERFKAEPADNLTTSLLRGEVDGENLSELEYASFFLLLCVAGNETTRTVTSNGFKLLLDHPEQLALLAREPARIPLAVEEILRFEPAVHYFRRTATRGHGDPRQDDPQGSEGGDVVPVGQPRRGASSPSPDRFDVTRADNEHLAFGIGEHFCLGANLARLELNVIFEELIARLRNPRLVAPPRRLRSNFINGVKEMRIAFDPA